MMKATPATPPAARQRGQQQQQQLPYRDDPNAPPSVRLESFTRGGYGPTYYASDGPVGILEEEKSKNLSITRKCWNAASECCRRCQAGANTQSTKHLSRSNGQNGHSINKNMDETDELYYEDNFNDLSWSCSFGTTDEHGIWLNQSDPAGTIMSMMVWVLILYSALTISFLAETGGIPPFLSMVYSLLAGLSLSSHVKTTLTDPGSVPASAVPTEEQRLLASHNGSGGKLSMCSQCQTFKPPHSHHCRICNRCISRMDHHCPWMNNCVGAGNMKHFLLFLIYTWTSSVFCLLLLGWNYFFCADETCVFNTVLTQLVRIMTALSVGAFLFTSSMLMNVVYGLMTGIGTIDRLKKKASGTMGDSEEEAIPLYDVFGINPYYTWPFPFFDPVFEDYDRVMGYSTPQRLLREQMRRGGGDYPNDGGSVISKDSYGIPI